MNNILLNENWEETIIKKCQCYERQREAEEMVKIKGACRDITTTYSMWSETGSCTGEGGNVINDNLGIIDKTGIRLNGEVLHKRSIYWN